MPAPLLAVFLLLLAAAEPAPPSDTAQWLASMDPQWQASYEREVLAPLQKASAELRAQFLGQIEAQLATATQAGEMDAAAYFRGCNHSSSSSPRSAPARPAFPRSVVCAACARCASAAPA